MKQVVSTWGVITTAPESYKRYVTYHKAEEKPNKPLNTSGTDGGWSPNNFEGAIWMCEKSAITIDEGEWGEVIRLKGEPGIPGDMGERGRLPYPSGIWSSLGTYKCTTKTASFVWYEEGKMYYVLNKEGEFTGINPADDYAANGLNSTWIPFENYKAIYVELLFARFGLLGSAVFYDDYMFSQYGVKADGSETTDYSGFNPELLGQSNCPFTPNLLFNFKEGTGHWGRGTLWFDIAGFIYSKSRIIQVYRNMWEELNTSPVQDLNIDLKKGTNLDLTTSVLDHETLILPQPESETVISLRFIQTTRSSAAYRLSTDSGFKLYNQNGYANYKYLDLMYGGIIDLNFIDGSWTVFSNDAYDYSTNPKGMFYLSN